MSMASEAGSGAGSAGARTPRLTLALCYLAAVFEGLDLQAAGVAAPKLAPAMGLNPARVFNHEQYVKFITGKGHGGQAAPAKLVDESVRILTNTKGRPLYSVVDGVEVPTVLASYGLIVNRDGLLESPANTTAPTRQVNAVLVPGGYMGTWARHNGAGRSIAMLYASGYTREAVYGAQSQAAAFKLRHRPVAGPIRIALGVGRAIAQHRLCTQHLQNLFSVGRPVGGAMHVAAGLQT